MPFRAAVLVLLIGCRGPIAAHVDGSPPDTSTGDAALDSRIPDSTGDIDGAPMRRPCTDTFGAALTATYGRMDGFLVAIVPPGPTTAPCRADTTHVHLQVLISGAVYDVAVNVGTNNVATNDVHSSTIEHALIGPAWSEGWHTNVSVDYAALGVHANAMPLRTQTENVDALMTDLATANHVSIYATGYSTDDGAHLVHRSNVGATDGLVVTHPLSPISHARLFSFSTQTF